MDSFHSRLVNSPLPETRGWRSRPLVVCLTLSLGAAAGAEAAETSANRIERAVVLRKLAEDRVPPDRAPVNLPPARLEVGPAGDAGRLGDPKGLDNIRRALDATRRHQDVTRSKAAEQEASESRQVRAFQDRVWRRELESQAAEKHRPGALPGPLPRAAQNKQQVFDREQAARDLSIRMQRRN